jgi:hypothetical protein
MRRIFSFIGNFLFFWKWRLKNQSEINLHKTKFEKKNKGTSLLENLIFSFHISLLCTMYSETLHFSQQTVIILTFDSHNI